MEVKTFKLEKSTTTIILHFIILLALTLPFWLFNLDITIQNFFYSKSLRWIYENNAIVLLLYNYGVMPALVCGGMAAVLFGLSFAYENVAKFRKQALLIILSLLLGPGLLINVIFKNYSGRPRPREITEYGGQWKFRNVLEFGVPGKGHSFPCGHCSMGFVFYAFYLIYRKRDRLKANISMSFAALYGIGMGAGRMLQGAHFASDVLWAAGITFITTETIFFKILKMEQEAKAEEHPELFKRNYALSYGTTAILLTILVGVVLLSTPFYEEKKYEFGGLQKAVSIKLNMEQGEVKITGGTGDSILINTSVRGFGMPGNKYKADIKPFKSYESSQIYANFLKNGIFVELNASLGVILPTEKNYQIIANDRQGDINFNAGLNIEKIVLYTAGGDINFEPIDKGKLKEVYLKTKSGDIIINLDKDVEVLKDADFNIRAQNGIVYIINKSKFLRELNDGKERFNGSKEIIYKSKNVFMDITAKKIIIY